MANRYAVLNDGNVVINIALANAPINDRWIDATGAKIGDTWTGTEFVTPEPTPEPVELDTLSTDKWTIIADGQDEATVTYTSDDPVHFVADGEIYLVEPVEQVATLEISANAAGPILVQVQDKQLTIMAVTL